MSTRSTAIFGQQYEDLYYTMRYDSRHFYGYVPINVGGLIPNNMVLRYSTRNNGRVYQKKPKPYKHVN